MAGLLLLTLCARRRVRVQGTVRPMAARRRGWRLAWRPRPRRHPRWCSGGGRPRPARRLHPGGAAEIAEAVQNAAASTACWRPGCSALACGTARRSSATAASCARDTRSSLDETRALRDESRRVIASLQARYADETASPRAEDPPQQRARLFRRGHRPARRALMAAPWSATFIHRQTLAGQVRFTSSELGELEVKIASAADRALGLELEIFERLAAQVIAESANIKRSRRGAVPPRCGERARPTRDRAWLCSPRSTTVTSSSSKRTSSGGRAGVVVRRYTVRGE